MNEKVYTRRKFIDKYLLGGSVKFGLGILIAGGSLKSMAQDEKIAQQAKNQQDTQKNPCDDLTGVSTEEVAKRKKLAYVNKTPIPDSHCSNCALYLPPAKDKSCGSCMLFKGPVRAEGYCAYWAPITN